MAHQELRYLRLSVETLQAPAPVPVAGVSRSGARGVGPPVEGEGEAALLPCGGVGPS